jgi:hypothetical protein
MEHDSPVPGRRSGTLTKPAARDWRGGLAALAGLIMLAAVGCSSSPSSFPSAARTGQNPFGGSSGTGGLVSPPTSDAGHGGKGKGGRAGPAGQALTANARSGITGGAVFGGDRPLLPEQPSLGRRLAMVRVYYTLGESFPRAWDRKIMASGSTLLVSLATVPPGPSYASIAAGQHDPTIRQFLQAVEQASITYHLGAIYFCFEHEANVAAHHAGLGSPAQFVQAWDHVHQLAVSAHLDWNQGGRLHWVWILGNHAFRQGTAGAYWPGADETDIVGVDGYNFATCNPSRPGTNFLAQGTQAETPADIFSMALSFAGSHGGLPVFIAEWASVPYHQPSVQPGFIHQMQQFVTSHPQIAAALYWAGQGPGAGCNLSLIGRTSSLSALAAMGRSAALQGHIV